MTQGAADLPHDLAAFRRVDTWVFDLDNTLYPPDSDLWPLIDARITAYLIALFGGRHSSRALQKYYYQRFGTTLSGLIHEYGIAPEEFLHFVHDIDRSSRRPIRRWRARSRRCQGAS